MRPRRALGLFVLWSGCTFGGSSEDPSVMIFPTLDAALDAPDGRMADPAPVEPAPDDPLPSKDAGVPLPMSPEPSIDAGAPEPDLCVPEAPAVACDPVQNSGCPPLSQCEVEPAATVRTGRCVLPQAPVGTQCSVLPFATVCTPQLTCVGGSCVKLCDCDTDCAAGTCCREDPAASNPILFKVCLPC